jgi:hypothetical protein
MSRRASSARKIDDTLTTLLLIGGNDCDPSTPISNRPDLDVIGGARIRKNLCVGSEAIVEGELLVQGNAIILGNFVLDSIDVDMISVETGTFETVTSNIVTAEKFMGNLSGDLCQDSTVFGNLTVQGNLDVIGNITMMEMVNANISQNKIILNDGEVGAGVTAGTAGLIIDRGSLENYLICYEEARNCLVVGNSAETCCVVTREDAPTDQALMVWDAASQKLVSISAGQDLDMACGNIANVEIISVETINPKTPGDDILINGNTLIAGDLQVQSGVTTTVFSGDELQLVQNAFVAGNVTAGGNVNSFAICANVFNGKEWNDGMTMQAYIDGDGNIQKGNIGGGTTTMLSDTGGATGVSLISDGTGPDLFINTLLAGNGIVIANNGGDTVITNNAEVQSLGGTSLVVSGTPTPDYTLKGLTAGSGIILTPSGTDITISSDVMTGNLDMMCNNISNVMMLEANTLVAKSGDLDVLSTLQMNENDLANVMLIAVETITPKGAGGSITLTGGPVLVTEDTTIGGNVDMTCNDILNVEVFQANTIQSKAGDLSVDVTGNIDLNCGNISNVMLLSVDTIQSKSVGNLTMIGNVVVTDTLFASSIGGSSPVDFIDEANFTSGTKITFVDGIEIGDSDTATTSSDSIAIGGNATTSSSRSIAIGADTIASSIDGIAIGSPFATNASADATAWGQVFQSRSWIGGSTGFAKIDTNGNLFKDTSPVAAASNCIVDTDSDTMVCANDNDTITFELNSSQFGIMSGSSFSFGGNVSATGGSSAHAEGQDTRAFGFASHAEGLGAMCSGTASHAEGDSTFIGGGASACHAEGLNSRIPGSTTASHVEGRDCFVSGDRAHAEGRQTSCTGDEGHSEGFFTIAGPGSASHAEGGQTEATATYSHAEGFGSSAGGDHSHAEGLGSIAAGGGSHAEGGNTVVTAAGTYAHAEGRFTSATGLYSHAEGDGTEATSNAAHAEGLATNATNQGSHAEGRLTNATGLYSHAEGNQTLASGDRSHAEGEQTRATNFDAHAEGQLSTASGLVSHAEGFQTTASGNYSHAAGRSSIANGTYAHVSGENGNVQHDWTWCWSGRSAASITSTAANQFIVHTGQARINNGAANEMTTATTNSTTTWSYNPLNMGDWTVLPTTIAEALDRIAANIANGTAL